jgi:FAD:protein FMN transferase
MTATVLGIADDRALGGSVRVIVTRPQSLAPAKAAVDGVLAAIDATASRFRQDSELSRLCAAPDRTIAVSPLLAQAIEAGLRGARLTDGAVDPTVGEAVRLAGYDSDFASVAASGGPLVLVAKRIPGWQAVQFDPARRSVRVPPGVELDLGATAKALAADLAAEAALKAAAGGGVLVSLGGDIAVAGEPPPGGWLIQTSEDSSASISDAEESVSIVSGGLATSGTTVRTWRRGEAVLHHVIDPDTGLPAVTPWRTATVAAASCLDANIASTAAIVMGERAPDWLRQHGLVARLVDRDGGTHYVGGWPQGDSKRVPNNL